MRWNRKFCVQGKETNETKSPFPHTLRNDTHLPPAVLFPVHVVGGHAYLGFLQLIRGWFGRRLAERRREEMRRRRREAMEAVWYVTVLGAMERSIARFDKVRASHAFQRTKQCNMWPRIVFLRGRVSFRWAPGSRVEQETLFVWLIRPSCVCLHGGD